VVRAGISLELGNVLREIISALEDRFIG
jgi:hypothetical protein